MSFKISYYTTITKTLTKFWALQESMTSCLIGELVFDITLLTFEY